MGRLEMIQRAAGSIRMIYNAGKYDSISERMKKLRLLPLRHRIIFKLLPLTFRCLNGTVPAYLSHLVSRYQLARDLRSASLGKLTVPLTRLEYGGMFFFSAAPTLWNDLPSAIRCSDLNTFKTELRKQLHTIVYPPDQKN